MYILDSCSISSQDSYNNSDYLKEIINHKGTKIFAIEPDYSGIIKPGQLRRMGKALRMGIATGIPLLNKFGTVDGIIIGTASGGLEGAMDFLTQIVEYDEGTLTPTNFIQSTPNNVAGQLALITNNKNYNNTHTAGALAFENALIDAQLLFQDNPNGKVLVGNVEEVSSFNYNIDKSAGFFKEEELDMQNLLNSNTKGTVVGEGASMFIVSNEIENRDKFVKILEVETFTYPDYTDVLKGVEDILNQNSIDINEVDAIMMGMNGDVEQDKWYEKLIEERFVDKAILSFKNLIGDYQTSSAFALKMANDILRGVSYSEAVFYKNKTDKKINSILIYNHFRENQHSLMLIVNDIFYKNRNQ